MNIRILKKEFPDGNYPTVFLVSDKCNIHDLPVSSQEAKYIERCRENDETEIYINRLDTWIYICFNNESQFLTEQLEAARCAGFRLSEIIHKEKSQKITLIDWSNSGELILALAEGIVLSGYRFLKYMTDKKKLNFPLEEIELVGSAVKSDRIEQFTQLLEAVSIARDLVNEPSISLNTFSLCSVVCKLGEESGFKVDILGMDEIRSLNMGGLLAVNKGSVDPPAFVIMEWKPERYNNEQPVVLVGKGITFDTGGINLKTQPAWIEPMKSDMSGGATVIATLYALAKAKMPVYAVGLVPVTDNRPGGNAIVPGDVITMADGSTVEVINTDAEGRLILADALHYAARYNPSLIIDVATLTGSAANAIGSKAMVGMQKGAQESLEALQRIGHLVHERIVEFPMWDDYAESLKSDVADLKNIGGKEAGAITAAKFLEHFATGFPWIHLDIAGPAFIESFDKYRGKGGTGVGVRLLFNYLKDYK
ncbi:MAG: leucyl aminopeptidase [Bacteroidota bacterium]|nr:leucyl aminopeptidase [Bacteroidota bacterium]